MLIRRPPPPPLREADTLDELREVIRALWIKIVRLEDELAARKCDRDDSEEAE